MNANIKEDHTSYGKRVTESSLGSVLRSWRCNREC